jgi:hypothetical protein
MMQYVHIDSMFSDPTRAMPSLPPVFHRIDKSEILMNLWVRLYATAASTALIVGSAMKNMSRCGWIRSCNGPSSRVIVEGQGEVREVGEKWGEPSFEVESEEALVVQLRRLYFPIWEVLDHDTGTLLDVRPSAPDGLLEVDVPVGVRRVVLRRVLSTPELWGRAVSGLAVIVLFYGAFTGFCQSRSGPRVYER